MSADQGGSTALPVTVNGEEQLVSPDATVASLVEGMGFEPRGIAVAVGGEVVPRRTWAETRLRAGEEVEILTIAQGG